MMNRILPVLGFVAMTAIASAALARGTPVSTLEEARYAGALQHCLVLADSDRMTCEVDVQAKITAAWKARIEEEARRPNNR